MAVFQLGPVIRFRREELGLSQEDLADGVCSVPTLSRIENGERMPTKNHMEILLQRLGYSATTMDFFTHKREFQIHELKFQVRQAYVARDFPRAAEYLRLLTDIISEPTNVDTQFILLHQVLINASELSNTQQLQRLEAALRLTCPKYRANRIPVILSYEEIILINNIAICYAAEGDLAQAILMLRILVDYYDHHIAISEEALRTQPMVLYNLSKFLGQSGCFDECIEICDRGIQIARDTGRCHLLGGTLFNRGWALLHRNWDTDREAAKDDLRLAYCFASVMQQKTEMQSMGEFYAQTFGEDLCL